MRQCLTVSEVVVWCGVVWGGVVGGRGCLALFWAPPRVCTRERVAAAVCVSTRVCVGVQVTAAVVVCGWFHVRHAQFTPWGAGSQTYYVQHLALFVTSFVFVMGLLFKVGSAPRASRLREACAWALVHKCVRPHRHSGRHAPSPALSPRCASSAAWRAL